MAKEKPRSMNKPAMMDWVLRLLRLLNEKKVLTSRIVADEFGVNIRTAQRYLLYLSDLPCVVVDEEKHTYSLTSDYVITDKILNTSEMALVCALIDYATHIFGKEHSKFLAGLKNRIFRMPDVYQFLPEEAIDMGRVASAQHALERYIKQKEVVSFAYRKKGKRYTVEPYKILYHDGFWYLVGLHDGIVKKFVLDFDLHVPARHIPIAPARAEHDPAIRQVAGFEVVEGSVGQLPQAGPVSIDLIRSGPGRPADSRAALRAQASA